MYARAHAAISPFATVSTVGPSATRASSPSATTAIVLLKPKATSDNTAGFPVTSRYHPATTPNLRLTGNTQATTSTRTVFIGEFTFPGEVQNSTSLPQNSNPVSTAIFPTTLATTAAFQKPSAPGTVEEESPLARVETRTQTRVRPLSRQQPKSSTEFIERLSPSDMNSRQRQKHISVVPTRLDNKQLAQVYRLSDELLKSYQEAFRIFDRNGDGCITCQELGTVMRSLGHQPSENELQDMINEVDVDGSGTIEFDEFVQMMTRRMADKQDDDGEELKEAFEVFDRNRDGYITAEELRQVMRSLGENLTDQELNEMMKAADANGDGIINFNEFQEVWTEAQHLTMKQI